MNKIIVVVANNNDCIESLKKAGDSIGVEIKSEIQSDGKIINELSVNDIKESTAVLFAIDGEVEEVEKIERFIDCEYYEVEEQFIKNDRFKCVQLQLPRLCCHGYGHVIANDMERYLVHHLRNDRIDLPWHNGGAVLLCRQVNFSQPGSWA